MRRASLFVLAWLAASVLHAQTGETATAPDVPQPRRSRVPYPPISVAAPVINVPGSIAAPQVGPVAPPAQIPRAAVITTCDAAGCWDSDGRRLNSSGPVLVGPGGACVAQAGAVRCP